MANTRWNGKMLAADLEPGQQLIEVHTGTFRSPTVGAVWLVERKTSTRLILALENNQDRKIRMVIKDGFVTSKEEGSTAGRSLFTPDDSELAYIREVEAFNTIQTNARMVCERFYKNPSKETAEIAQRGLERYLAATDPDSKVS